MALARAQSIRKTLWNYAQDDIAYPIINAVVDSARQNTSIMPKDIGGEPGKKRTLRIDYIAPDCDDSGTCNTDLCVDGGKTMEPNSIFYDLKKCTASPVYKYYTDSTRGIDDLDGDEFARRQLTANFSTVRKKLAEQLTAVMVQNAGRFPDGRATKRIVMIDPVTGNVRPYAFNELERAYTDMHMGAPYVVGGSSVFHAQKNVRNLQQSTATIPAHTYYEILVNNAYGSGENILTWDPNYFKFLSWSRNAGQYMTDFKQFNLQTAWQQDIMEIRATLLDPVTQLLWDFNGVRSVCGKYWQFQFQIEWDIFFLPATSCLPAGVNGILHWTGCEPAEIACPSDSGQAPIPTASTYSWTPGAIFPVAVSKALLNGQEYRPNNVNVTNVTELTNLLNSLSNVKFSVNGGSIRYTGYSAYTGSINDNITMNFATV